MEIGTSIFLSTTFLSLIILYVNTKDRWNWKRTLKITSFGMIGVFSFIGVCIFWVEYQDNQPQVVGEFQGIKLGCKKADVIFKLGEPYRFSKDEVIEELKRRGIDTQREYEKPPLTKEEAYKLALERRLIKPVNAALPKVHTLKQDLAAVEARERTQKLEDLPEISLRESFPKSLMETESDTKELSLIHI